MLYTADDLASPAEKILYANASDAAAAARVDLGQVRAVAVWFNATDAIRVAMEDKFLSETQDKQNCRVLRFVIGRLTSRNRNQAAQAVEELPPDLEELLGGIE
jgi:hypothetical protein